MSEEILKALTTLFALIVKQDGGANENEIAYVKRFLIKQLNPETASEYFALFLKEVKIKDSVETGSLDDRQKELVSVKDSVKILGIAKKISKTLDQKQKVVVLVRLFELINSDRQFTEQRMSIIDTVSKVFRISGEEYSSIERFACSNLEGGISDPDIMVVSDETGIVNSSRFILVKDLDGSLVILRVKSVDLYFFRYSGQQVCQLNGLNINRESIYMLAYGSALKLPVGKPVYYSDVVDHFQDELEYARISYHVHDLEYRFKSGKIGVRNISLSEKQGRLVGILGASGAGKTTLFNVLSGLEKPSKGKVLINGIDLHREKKKLEGVIGYIPQDDLLIEELTVFKNLYYNAKLCFSGKSMEEITEMVNHLLASL
ncbi:MAG: ATP-binding cassette domain-containing protein, partial [Bacteroidota bacterium]